MKNKFHIKPAEADDPYGDLVISSRSTVIARLPLDDAPVRDFNSEQRDRARRIVDSLNGESKFIIVSLDTYNDCGVSAFEDAFGPYTEEQADDLLKRLRANQGVGQSWRKHDLSSTKIYDPYSGNSIEPEEN